MIAVQEERTGEESRVAVSDDLEQLYARAHELADLGGATAVLGWDQETMMPRKGGEARAWQLSTLQGIYHERLTDPKVGEILDGLASATGSELGDVDRALIRELRRDYDRAVKIPNRLVRQLGEATSRGVEVWREARERSDFSLFADDLRAIVDLKRQVADHVGYEGSPYNALLDEFEPGQTAEQTKPVFDGLRTQTVALLDEILRSPVRPDAGILERSFDTAKQLAFTEDVLRAMGFDFDAGRQDLSTHPFTTSFDPRDVRVTTRVQERHGASALMGSIHEGGHALYEQGVDLKLARTLLGTGTSLGIHESQSRMWENLVGRSTPFWEHFYRRLTATFPESLVDVPLDAFVGALNAVAPSLVRVEADEVTYNLHIILRFEIELLIIEGAVRIEELPDVWNAKMREYLGITPPNDALGVLQDIHWSSGLIGYFPTYSLGNLYAAQFYATARKQFPDFDDRLRRGELLFLREWLRDAIHQYGRTLTAGQLVERVTSERLNPAYLGAYLRDKYGTLYGL